jgi:hypothetical protein
MSEETSGPGFSRDAERLLASVLDEIIPPSDDGRFPGAGALGLAGFVEQNLRSTPELRPVVEQGLSALEELAKSRGASGFAALPRRDKREVLRELSATQPVFVPGLILHAYAGYYQDSRVIEALGLEPRPPYPEGYELEAGDLTLLEPVRRRPAMFRKC